MIYLTIKAQYTSENITGWLTEAAQGSDNRQCLSLLCILLYLLLLPFVVNKVYHYIKPRYHSRECYLFNQHLLVT